MFWICDQNNADNTLMFLLVLLFLSPIKAFSVSHAAPSGRGWGWSKVGRRQSQNSWPQWLKGCSTLYDPMLSIKAVGKEEKEGTLGFWCLSSPGSVTCEGALLSWEWLNTYSPMGSSKLIPYFVWLACAAFALPLVFTSTYEISHFYPASSLAHPAAEEWVSGWLGLSC